MVQIYKRDNRLVEFDKDKIYEAISKAYDDINKDKDVSGEVVEFNDRAKSIADSIEAIAISDNDRGITLSVEEVQDMVEERLMGMGYLKLAKAYILYRSERNKERNKGWELTDLQRDIYEQKYRWNNETFDEFLDRVSGGNKTIAEIMRKKRLLPAGRILAGRGTNGGGRSVCYSNCFVQAPPEDNIPSIFETAKKCAETYKKGGGVGLTLKYLRPRGTKVNNTAKASSGAASFSQLYDTTTSLISQGNRAGALLLTLPVDHPDAEEFINMKTNSDAITKANISLGITNDFMEAVKNMDRSFTQSFNVIDTGEVIEKKVDPLKLFRKIAENAHGYAEPGLLFWDNINNNHINDQSEIDFYESVNPCVTGETIVAVADGRNGVPIKDLVGQEFPVYSGRYSNNKGSSINNDKWVTEIKSAIAFKTGTKEVVTIKLSDGSEFECTPDHQLALADGDYIEAQFSKGMRLGKFFSFSEKNNEKSYRHINSKTSKRQYHMMGNYYGLYDTSMNRPTIHHIDNDSTNDNISNLQCVEFESHMEQFSDSQKENNTMKKDLNFNYNQALRTVRGNAKRYSWDKSKLLKREQELLEQYKPNLVAEDKNVKFEYDVFVEDVIYEGKVVDVYDLNVEDNHNFYIITQTDDDKFLNSSGVLIHNCGEKPLVKSNSCLLASLNLSEYIKDPFTDKAKFDRELFKQDLREIVIYMDDLLEEGVEFLPLPENKDTALDYRSLGIGVMGLGEALIKLGKTYGKLDAIIEVDNIFNLMANTCLQQSALLAKHRGTYPLYDKDIVLESNYLKNVANKETRELIEKYGLRNSELLSIAPTGSISTMMNVSGGVEPVFQFEYNRRTVTLNSEETVYKVIAPIVKEYREVTGNEGDLPDYFVSTYDIPYRERIDMQSRMQKYIDSAISSTVNLPNETTVEEVEDLYMYAWEQGCKGITIYREGCMREGILTTDKPKDKEEVTVEKKEEVCPICGGEIIHSNGCKMCADCQWGACSL